MQKNQKNNFVKKEKRYFSGVLPNKKLSKAHKSINYFNAAFVLEN